MPDENEVPEFDAKKFYKDTGVIEKAAEEWDKELARMTAEPPKKKRKEPTLKELEEELPVTYPEEPSVPLEDIEEPIPEEPTLEAWPISQVLTDRKLSFGVINEGAWIAEAHVGADQKERDEVKKRQSLIINSALKMLLMPDFPKQGDEEIDCLRLKIARVFKTSMKPMKELRFNFERMKELLEMSPEEIEERGLNCPPMKKKPPKPAKKK